MKIYSKELLIEALREIRQKGWICNGRHGNDGGVGNTLEDLLGIEENNLPIPNSGEWELKCQKINTTSLITLFHMEPSPRAMKFVPQILLPSFGWRHQKAGSKYPENEMSFRQTINAENRSDRGFGVIVDRKAEKVIISFNPKAVNDKHMQWLTNVEARIGLKELSPQPYWGFDDLFHKVADKLNNCFYVQAEVKRQDKKLFFWYKNIFMLKKVNINGVLLALEEGNLLVDFDARTGHNHGTKFRLRQNCLPELYSEVKEF